MVISSHLLVDGARVFRRLAAWPFQAVAARQTLTQLAGLDDRELADIGLTRQDLSSSDPSGVLKARGEDRRLRRSLVLGEARQGAEAPVALEAAAPLAPTLQDIARRPSGSDLRLSPIR